MRGSRWEGPKTAFKPLSRAKFVHRFTACAVGALYRRVVLLLKIISRSAFL